jgi:hypothetical protein
MQRAAWTQGGQHLEFHAHTDAGGMGSSLISDSVYREGYCDGNVTCTKSQALFFFLLVVGAVNVLLVILIRAHGRTHPRCFFCMFLFCFVFSRIRHIQREAYQSADNG